MREPELQADGGLQPSRSRTAGPPVVVTVRSRSLRSRSRSRSGHGHGHGNGHGLVKDTVTITITVTFIVTVTVTVRPREQFAGLPTAGPAHSVLALSRAPWRASLAAPPSSSRPRSQAGF